VRQDGVEMRMKLTASKEWKTSGFFLHSTGGNQEPADLR